MQGRDEWYNTDVMVFAMRPDAMVSDLCHEIESLNPSLSPLKLFYRQGHHGCQVHGPESLFDRVSPGGMPGFEKLYRLFNKPIPVRSLNGYMARVVASSDDTVDGFKGKFQDFTGIPGYSHRLIFGGAELEGCR